MKRVSFRITGRAWVAVIIAASLVLIASCAKYKTVAENTALVENPGEKKVVNVENGKVSRGEYVKVVEEKDFDGKTFIKVQLEGVDTRGWLERKYLLDGKLTSMYITADADMFARPTVKSEKTGRARGGQQVLILKDAGEFSQVSISGKEAFIQKTFIGPQEAVVRTVAIPGIGNAKVRCSSYLITASSGELKYDPRNCFDRSIQTAWVEGKSGDDGIGEWVSIQFDEPVNLTGIEVVNGFAANENWYKANNRVASLRIEAENRTIDWDFSDDNYDYQAVTPEDGVLNLHGSTFKFIITKVHKGKVPDTVIGEIKLAGSLAGGRGEP